MGYTFLGAPHKEQCGMTEQWRDVSGYDGIYQVSDQGQVRNTHTSKILQPVRIKNGRLYVTLSSDGFQRKCTVHSLVAAAFLGDCPPQHETTHKDGDYTNNAAQNLEYVTRGENQKRFVMRSGGYSVNLTKRVQTANGMRYCPVAESANGRVKPDIVLVNRKEERHAEGAYYLVWREGSKRVRLSVGKDPADASARRQRKEAELNAVNNGVSVVPDGQNGIRSVAAAVAEFLDETKLTKKPKTLAAYSTALAYFVESCHKLNLEEIDRKDLLKFSAFLRDEKDQAPRSVYNKFENVMTFLKAPVPIEGKLPKPAPAGRTHPPPTKVARASSPTVPPVVSPATSPAASPATSPATLEIEVEHNFAAAHLSIWVDDRLTYTHQLEGTDKKHLVVFHHVQGHEFHAMQVSPGKHSLRVQVTTDGANYDQSATVEGEFASGQENVLRINFDKHREMNLSLQ